MRTKASVLLRSGLGAPVLIATPMPARAKSTRRPTTLPSLISLSITGGLPVTTSAGAYELTFSITLRSWLATTLWPLARSKPAARSRMPEILPCEPRTRISAARAPCAISAKPRALTTMALNTFNMTILPIVCSRTMARSARIRLHMGLAQKRRSPRRNHEGDHGTRGLGLLRARQQRHVGWARLVDVAGHGPDIIGPRHPHHDVGLLDAKLELAARQIIGDRAGSGAHRLGLQLLGEPELLDAFRNMRAAAAKGIADRLRRDQRRLVGLDGADIGLRRAGAHRNAKARQHERRHRARHHLALLDQLFELLGIGGEQIAGRIGVEPALERGARFLDHRHLVPARLRERGRELAHAWRRALIGQDNKIGRGSVP